MEGGVSCRGFARIGVLGRILLDTYPASSVPDSLCNSVVEGRPPQDLVLILGMRAARLEAQSS